MAALTAKSLRNKSYADPVLPVSFRYTLGRRAYRCESCQGKGCFRTSRSLIQCNTCNGIGYFNIDPSLPTICPPGTEECIVVMRARWAAELPMTHPDDATLEDFRVDQTEFTPVSDLQGAGSKVCQRVDNNHITDLPFQKAEASVDEIIDGVISREKERTETS